MSSVEIRFDCLPLRSVGRTDIPLDASPKFRAKCERILQAMERFGTHNSYFLHNALCTFRLTNSEQIGMIEFRFEGTVTTDANDERTASAHLTVELVRETCDWLTEPVVHWFAETVEHAVIIEFDRYISAGDLAQTLTRLEKMQAASDAQGGFVGMYL